MVSLHSSHQRILILGASLLLLAVPISAQDKSAAAAPQPASKTGLTDKENPELVGKRNINKSQINFYSYEKEVALGRSMAQEVDQSAKLIDDPIIAEYINRVGQNLVLHSDAKVPFTIKVLESDEVNAFALPGGFFYVNRGLILAAESEAELAGPMAHEIAHVAARHGVEQASKGELINWGSIPLIFLGGWAGYAIQQAAALAIPLGFLKFTRAAEEEADMLAAQYMWAAGYDPHSLVTFFEKLETKEKKKPGTMAKIFITHPVVGDRITKVNSLIARFPNRSEYLMNTSDFNQAKSRLVSISNVRATTASRGGAAGGGGDSRPTLKKRQPSQPGTDPNAPPATSTGTGSSESESKQAPERPTLKKNPNGSPTKDPGNP